MNSLSRRLKALESAPGNQEAQEHDWGPFLQSLTIDELRSLREYAANGGTSIASWRLDCLRQQARERGQQ